MADEKDDWTFKITLVRHGETSENRSGIIQGQMDTLLNEEGKRQVILVSERLRCEYFTRVFSSDLQRALKTAEGISLGSRFCQNIKICLEPLLRERRYGVAEGKPVSELKAFREQGVVVDGAETVQCIHKRAKVFFAKLLKEVEELRESDEGIPVHILLVSHGGWIRSLIQYFAKDFPGQFPSEKNKRMRRSCPNTGVTIFEIRVDNNQVKNIECLLFYDQSHLR